jgi:hypothetical protein
LRHSRRDEPARHIGRKRNPTADGGTHSGKPGAVEKTASAWLRHTSENQGVGPFRIVAIKLLK